MQVARLGMGKALGNLSFKPGNSEEYQDKPYSEATSNKIDLEVRELVGEVSFLFCSAREFSTFIRLKKLH